MEGLFNVWRDGQDALAKVLHLLGILRMVFVCYTVVSVKRFYNLIMENGGDRIVFV